MKKIYLTFFLLMLIIPIIYSVSIIMREAKYFDNKSLNGKIKAIEIIETDNPEIAGYYQYKYTVIVNDKVYYANTNRKIILKINDNVSCVKKGEKSLRIVVVNGKKIQSKFGFDFYISISILIVSLLVLICLINKIKK